MKNREFWHAAVHGVAKSQIWPSKWTMITFIFKIQKINTSIYVWDLKKSVVYILHLLHWQSDSLLLAPLWKPSFRSDQFRHSVVSKSLLPHGMQHMRLPCSSSTPRACSKSCPSSRWCHQSSSVFILFLSSVIPFSSCLNLSQNQSLFQWVGLSHQVAKVLEFQLQHHPFQWIFRTYFL